MNLSDFATRHRLKLAKDEWGESVILGRIGASNIYEYSDDLLAFVTDAAQPPRTGPWNKFKAACLAAGMEPLQSGDAEGSFTFDQENKLQAKVAIKGIRARAKRQVSPEQAAAGAARLLAARQAQILAREPQQEAIP